MHIMKKQVLLIILLALPLWLKAADVSVTGLRTEQMVDPMGLDTAAPRMSWRLESSQRNVMQTAYRILVASSPELLAQDICGIPEKWNPMRPYGFPIKGSV